MESREVDLSRVLRSDTSRDKLEFLLSSLPFKGRKGRMMKTEERIVDMAPDLPKHPAENECGLKPLGMKVVLLLDPDPTKTEGGIMLTETMAKNQMVKATVIQIGYGTRDDKFFVQPGSRVIVSRHAGNHITHLGVDYLIASQDNLIAVITKDAPQKAEESYLGE